MAYNRGCIRGRTVWKSLPVVQVMKDIVIVFIYVAPLIHVPVALLPPLHNRLQTQHRPTTVRIEEEGHT